MALVRATNRLPFRVVKRIDMDAFLSFKQQLQRAHHRQLMVLCGETPWQLACLQKYATEGGIWLGQSSPLAEFVSRETTTLRHYLGQEVSHAVLSAEQGIDAQALALVSGMVRGGGLVWILLPPANAWLETPNPANQRFMSYPLNYQQAWYGFNRFLWDVLQQHACWWQQNQAPILRTIGADASPVQQLSDEQQQGLRAILALVASTQPRPLLIDAKRGRGKSTLLGEAVYQMMQQGQTDIIVSAMRRDQCERLFARLFARLGDCALADGVRFVAPDALLAKPHSASIVLVDEAAHWPIAMLSCLLKQYPRVVLATTLQGYEGSARGFDLKLMPQLNQQFAGWQRVRLTQPMRWHASDPLEALSEQLMGEHYVLADLTLEATQNQPIRYIATDFQQLSCADFAQVWALLREAHYQTTPGDVQQWLSAPDLNLMLAKQGDQVIGVLLALAEGELPTLERSRRVKGHLVPQRLRQVSGENALLSARWQRIMRLAIHPQRRRCGIGQALTRAWLAQQNSDWVCVSYGLTKPLLAFWQRLGFHSVHLGAKHDKASGCYNLIMVQSERQRATCDYLRQRHGEQLIHQLLDSARDIDADLAFALLAEVARSLTAAQRQCLHDYSHNLVAYEAVLAELWYWALAQASDINRLDAGLQQLIYAKLIQKKPWSSLSQGRKPFEQQLKMLIQGYLENTP